MTRMTASITTQDQDTISPGASGLNHSAGQAAADSAAIDACWLALMARPLYEKVVSEALAGRGVQSFVPCYSTRRRWSDRVKRIDAPLFPGYVFARIGVEQRALLRCIPGWRGIVSFGGKAAPVDPGEIGNLLRIVEGDGRLEPHPYLWAGQRVCIVRGPLSGVEGFLSEVKDCRRVVVTISLLQRSVAVQLDPGMLIVPARASAPVLLLEKR